MLFTMEDAPAPAIASCPVPISGRLSPVKAPPTEDASSRTEVFVCLLRCCFQCSQFFLGILNGLSEKLLLLPDQFRIGGIKLQQLFDVLQLCLGALDILVDTLQGFRELASVPFLCFAMAIPAASPLPMILIPGSGAVVIRR